MKKISAKKLSFLGLILMVASAVMAAVIPDKSNGKRVKNGTLRFFSGTNAGVDRDAPEANITCPPMSGAVSCSATVSNTTTGVFANESRLQIGEFYYQTVGNTSQTAAVSGDQNSVLQVIA